MKRKKVYYFILFLVLFMPSSVWAQVLADSSPAPLPFFEVQSGYGVMVRHRPKMAYLQHHIPSIQVKTGRQTLGKDVWEQLYFFPEYGAGLYWANLGDNELLGNLFGCYTYLNFPILRKPAFHFSYQYSAGLSYISRYFTQHDNNYNIAVSTPINLFFSIQLNAEFRISPRLFLKSGFGLTHSSNGGYSMPNMGINITDLNIGMKYYLRQPDDQFVNKTVPSYKSTNEISVLGMGGIKSTDPAGSPKTLFSTFSISLSRQINHKRKIGFGTDIMYDESLYRKFNKEQDVHFTDVIRNGLFLSHEFIIKRLTIVTQAGTYTYTKVEPPFIIFTRTGFRYSVSPHVFVNLTLKAHAIIADCLEWGIAYRWNP